MVTPVLLAFIVLLVYAARVTRTQGEIENAARDAARAASIERDAANASAAANDVAAANLDDAGINCTSFSVVTDTSSFAPDGTVRVSVSCTVGLDDLGLLGVPSSRTMTASFTAPIDALRGTT